MNNGFFGTNHVVHTGEEIFEMNKGGVTASGKNSTGTDNGNTRSTVARACQPEEIVDALLGEVIVLPVCQQLQALPALFEQHVADQTPGYFQLPDTAQEDTVSAVGDDLTNALETDLEKHRRYGVLPDKEQQQDGACKPIDCTSHLFTSQKSGECAARYGNFAKLCHRVGELSRSIPANDLAMTLANNSRKPRLKDCTS